MKIAIVDYGMGNIESIKGVLSNFENIHLELTSDFEILKSVDRIILPGVGSFHSAMSRIREKKIDSMLYELCVEKNRIPLLGICLGMQLLAESSTEEGYTQGLGFLPGSFDKFNAENSERIPHVGFNQVAINTNSILFKNFINTSPDYYFTHSFRMLVPEKANIVLSTTHYGEEFVSAFESENIYGVQFHPELSQSNGVKLMHNFINLT